MGTGIFSYVSRLEINKAVVCDMSAAGRAPMLAGLLEKSHPGSKVIPVAYRKTNYAHPHHLAVAEAGSHQVPVGHYDSRKIEQADIGHDVDVISFVGPHTPWQTHEFPVDLSSARSVLIVTVDDPYDAASVDHIRPTDVDLAETIHRTYKYLEKFTLCDLDRFLDRARKLKSQAIGDGMLNLLNDPGVYFKISRRVVSDGTYSGLVFS